MKTGVHQSAVDPGQKHIQLVMLLFAFRCLAGFAGIAIVWAKVSKIVMEVPAALRLRTTQGLLLGRTVLPTQFRRSLRQIAAGMNVAESRKDLHSRALMR